MEFADYEYKDLYAYLMLQNETAFRIIMERHFAEPKDDKIMIVTEYYDALYFGEKLSEFSHDFCYNVPSEYCAIPFTYEFTTSDIEKLAEILIYLIKGIVVDSETEEMMKKYWDDKEEFWDQYCNNKIEPVCQGLLHIMENNINS
jgi:hypothetical protein